MTTLICTKCSDPVTVTSRSAVLPFVCDPCQTKVSELAIDAATYTASDEEPECCNAGPGPETEPEKDAIREAMLLDMAAQLQQVRTDLTVACDSKDFLNRLYNHSLKRQEELGIENFRLSKAVVALLAEVVRLAREVEVRDKAGQQVCDELKVAHTMEEASHAALGRVLKERDNALDFKRKYEMSMEHYRKEMQFWNRRANATLDELGKARAALREFKESSLWNRLWRKAYSKTPLSSSPSTKSARE